MSISDDDNYIEKIKQERRIISSLRPSTGFDNKVTDVQLSFHNQWAKPAFSQSKYKYSYAPLQEPEMPDSELLINDLSPVENSSQEELDIKRIKEIYEMKNEKEVKFSPLSSMISYDLTFYPRIPHDLLEPAHGWISFSLGKCTLPKEYESQEITGFVQLYDGKNSSPASEPVRFYITKSEAFFSQTIASSVYFPISTIHPFIFCVLNFSHKSAKCPIPFALDIVPLFSEKGQFLNKKKFSSKWAVYSDDFQQLIKNKISKSNGYEKVDIEFDFNCTFFEKVEREFSYSWSSTPNTNYYVSPFPNFSYQSTPTIFLFNFNLMMKYPSNAKYVFMKLYIADGIENIGSPKKMPLFCGIEKGGFSDVYVTTANKVGEKEIEFIDQVSIFVDRVFLSIACAIFHIFTFDSKNEPHLLGYAAIPLFQDQNPLPYGDYKLQIFDVKKPPKEMKKLIIKSSKKKDYLQCQIRLPPPYFPPSTVKNVIDAVMPEQALPPNYKEISLDVYQRQVLPMTGKLLKIIAPNTALHLIRFLDIFENEKKNIASTLRSWIFNVMDPTLFDSNFVNNLCNAFKSIINDKLWNNNIKSDDPTVSLRETKNLLLKQLGFALPLILDIILVSVSNPDINYDNDTILDFISLIPGIIYPLVKNRIKSNCSKIEDQNQPATTSRASHNHHISHLQRKTPIYLKDPDQLSSDEKKDSSESKTALAAMEPIMAPLRLPQQAMAPIIPDLQAKSHRSRSASTTTSSLIVKRSSQFIIDRNPSENLLSQKNINEEIDLNNHFANLISCLLPIIGFDKISPIIFKYIYILNTKKTTKNHSYLSYIQFSFLMPFSFSEQFIVELALSCKTAESSSDVSAYIPILSQIYLVLHKSLGQNENNNDDDFENYENDYNEIDAVEVACKFFSNICLSAEKLPSELSEKVAFILFPLINIISTNYEGAFVKQNSQILKELIPVILFILSASNTKLIQNYFSELGTSFQMHFMNFLEFVVCLSIERLNSIRPVSTKVNNLNSFRILTQHILNFLMRTIDIIGPCIDLVVKLLKSLYNSYQPISNIQQFYIVCANLIQKYPVNRSMILWLLSFLSFEQPDTKCFACSLLVLVFEADFKNTNTVVISSIDMMDSLTAVLLAVPVKYIPIYQTLLNRIITLTNSKNSGIEKSHKKEFEKMVNERMKASLIILNVVQEQKQSTSPPEIRCQRLMRIADQYKAFPTMRLKWLQEIVKLNKQQKIYSAAFTAQLHACCLIETVVYQLQTSNLATPQSYNSISQLSSSSSASSIPQTSPNSNNSNNSTFNFYLKTTQPMRNAQLSSFKLDSKEDFSFMPGVLCETELDIKSLGKDSQTLLSDFTINLLLESLDKAIQLGKSACLDYSLRPLYSLQLRIHQFKRNESQMISDVLYKLSESIMNIQTKSSMFYDLPLSFFLVEHRKSDKQKMMQVFCVDNSMVDMIMPFIDAKGRFKEGTTVSYCTNHSSETCTNDDSVCVIRLQPVLKSKSRKNEFDHCFKKFVAIQNLTESQTETVDIIEYKTKDFLPHYRLAADVVNEKRRKVDRISHIKQLVNNAVDLINRVADEFEIWYPLKPLNSPQSRLSIQSKSEIFEKTDENCVIDDIKRISAVLRFVLKGNESIATILLTVLQILKEKNDTKKIESVKSMAVEIQKSVARILSVYRRAVSEFKTKQPNQSLLSMCEMMADEFSQSFELEEIEENEYVADFDPMNDGIEYNE